MLLPSSRACRGLWALLFSKRTFEGGIEFLVLTRWESLECIKRFAGADIAKAIVEPGAVAQLVDFDGAVQHYECVEEI